MKFLIVFLVTVFALSAIPISFAEPYWGNLDVDIEKSDRIEGERSDVIRIRAEFTNNDDEEITIFHEYVKLDDSKHREFSHDSYFDLRKKGHDVTERECPWDFYVDLNPGISEEVNMCFEVPKENVEFTLHIYESYLDWCKDPPWGSCQEKTIRLVVNPPSPKSSSSPTQSNPVSSDTNQQTTNVDADIIIPRGTGFPGCEETRSCYIPYRLSFGRGSTVTWYNSDDITHTVTSGTPSNGPDGEFDSSLIYPGRTYSNTFRSDGVINYFCMVHPWMVGQLVVERGGTILGSATQLTPSDTTPPKMLKPNDVTVDAESQYGAKVIYEVLAIDDTDELIRPSCNPSSGSLFSIGKTVVTCNAMDSSGNRASPVSFTVTVNPLPTVIPDWVKNVAAFWCDEMIDDAAFIDGIQYLIDNNIITVNSTPSGNSGTQEIPQWIKNNACWWSSDSISDKDFASGLEYLVRNGIILV